MPLDPDKIKQLMAIKNAPKQRKTRAKGIGGKRVDTSIRNYETWFALDHRMGDHETGELLHCENPNCKDPRQKGIMVVEVNNTFMCRFCFLGGWLGKDPAQEELKLTEAGVANIVRNTLETG